MQTKEERIEVQLKGLRFSDALKDSRRTVAMMVMVHRLGYNDTVDTLLEIGRPEVQKEEYPTTYDVHCDNIRVSSDCVEERYQNAYLLQVQYYLNRVIVKLVGIPKEINIEEFTVAPERHRRTKK